MGKQTNIEWAHATWSPWHGCLKVSSGCQFCYAESLSKRFGQNIWGPESTTTRRIMSDYHWSQPLVWNRQAQAAQQRMRVFPSMCDPFESHHLLNGERERFWNLIEKTPWLDWLLLTKRPENVTEMVPRKWLLEAPRSSYWPNQWPANVWIGTSVENQEYANIRINQLCQIPAQIRFLSLEPLIGPIDLEESLDIATCGLSDGQIDWIICGAESGPKARPMDLNWVRTIRDQCKQGKIPFFFKQTATNGKKESMPELDGEVWAQYPEVQTA